MSSLSFIEKQCLEKVLDMLDGYVLDFSNRTFDEFFRDYRIAIYDDKYGIHGNSKANRMRTFWELETDQTVAKVLIGMLDICETGINEGEATDTKNLSQGRRIIKRLLGGKPMPEDFTEQKFLEKEYAVPNINRLPIPSPVAAIIQNE